MKVYIIVINIYIHNQVKKDLSTISTIPLVFFTEEEQNINFRKLLIKYFPEKSFGEIENICILKHYTDNNYCSIKCFTKEIEEC